MISRCYLTLITKHEGHLSMQFCRFSFSSHENLPKKEDILRKPAKISVVEPIERKLGSGLIHVLKARMSGYGLEIGERAKS